MAYYQLIKLDEELNTNSDGCLPVLNEQQQLTSDIDNYYINNKHFIIPQQNLKSGIPNTSSTDQSSFNCVATTGSMSNISDTARPVEETSKENPQLVVSQFEPAEATTESPLTSPPALTFEQVNKSSLLQPDNNNNNTANNNMARESSVEIEIETPHSCLTTNIPLTGTPSEFGTNYGTPMIEQQVSEDSSNWPSLFEDEQQNHHQPQITTKQEQEQQQSTTKTCHFQNNALRDFLNNSDTSLLARGSTEIGIKPKDSAIIINKQSQSQQSGIIINNENDKPSKKRNNSAPENTNTNTPTKKAKTNEEKALMKRARNTEAARRSRARKSERLSDLEKRCEHLSQRNQYLEMEILRLRLLMAKSGDLRNEEHFKALFCDNL